MMITSARDESEKYEKVIKQHFAWQATSRGTRRA
jgi:hypothetical protein